MNVAINGTDLPQTSPTMPQAGTNETETGSSLNCTGCGMCGGHNMSMSMGGMMMYFHTGLVEYILLEQLQTHTATGFAWACFIVFAAAFLYELMKYGREELLRHDQARLARMAHNGNDEESSLLLKPKKRLCSRAHLTQTALHGIQLWLSYCLMLIFMTYNVFLCLSLVLGATLGYFLTGWKRTQVIDHTQHCE